MKLKKHSMEALISEIYIHEERKENGQWLKSIKFKFPVIEESINIILDSNSQNECITLIQKVKS